MSGTPREPWTLGPEIRGVECPLVEEVREKIRTPLIAIWGPEPPFALGGVKAFATSEGVASQILCAVNAHDALVAALRWALNELCPPVRRIPGQNDAHCDGWDRARAALALAEGQ